MKPKLKALQVGRNRLDFRYLSVDEEFHAGYFADEEHDFPDKQSNFPKFKISVYKNPSLRWLVLTISDFCLRLIEQAFLDPTVYPIGEKFVLYQIYDCPVRELLIAKSWARNSASTDCKNGFADSLILYRLQKPSKFAGRNNIQYIRKVC